MKDLVLSVATKSKQFYHRLFYADTSKSLILYFSHLLQYINALHEYITFKRLKLEEPRFALISDNLFLKIIVFIYSLFTNSRLFIISPRFSISEITYALLSIRNLNILIADTKIINNIKIYEEEEGINILSFFKVVLYTNHLFDVLNAEIDNNKDNISDFRVIRKLSTFKKITHDKAYQVSILSSGTTSFPSIVNLLYSTLCKTAFTIAFFTGLKPGQKVSILADFEEHPVLFTILGLITGVTQVQLTEDNEITSAKELKHSLNNKFKIDQLFISSTNFKVLWNDIMSNTYSNKFWYFLSSFKLTKWIVNYVLKFKIESVFDKVKKVHILNEELGTYPLTILRKSKKIMFTSSYGYLEQGNFLAFKDPILFKHSKYSLLSGGTLLKTTSDHVFDVLIKSPNKDDRDVVNEIHSFDQINRILSSEDIGKLIENSKEQGDRHFLNVLGRKDRNPNYSDIMVEEIEKVFKDSILIRDCVVVKKELLGKTEFHMFIEARIDVIDANGISFSLLNKTIANMLKTFYERTNINISKFAIIPFDGIRNIAGKIQYYNM